MKLAAAKNPDLQIKTRTEVKGIHEKKKKRGIHENKVKPYTKWFSDVIP